MENSETKDLKEFKILYEWLQIARKPHQNVSEDVQMLMDLIDIPVSASEVNFLAKTLSHGNAHSKLERESFLNYFLVPEEKKKQTEKQVVAAFKYVANNEDDIPLEKLMECLLQEGLDEKSADLVLKQVGDCEKENGRFDYKQFASSYDDK